MANLLPKKIRRTLQQQELLRLVVIGLLIFLVTVGIGTIALIPSYLFAKVAYDTAVQNHALVTQKQEYISKESITKELREAVGVMTLAKIQQQKHTFTEAVQIVEAQAVKDTPHIDIVGYTYMRGVDTQGEIRVAGIARNRDVLVDFSKSLEATPLFVKSILPVSELTGGSDVEFTLTLIGDF